MALCCSSSAGCRCRVVAEADDGCNPVTTTVTGVGSEAVPFTIGTSFDFTRMVRLDGNEPWAMGTDGSCPIIVPRAVYDAPDFQFMCDGAGTLVGYALRELDVVTGVSTNLFQAVDSTSTSSALPSGWNTCCTEANVGGFAPMYTDGEDVGTFVGYVFIRYDNETDAYQQRYVTLDGTETDTLPVGWEAGVCAGTGDGGGGGDAEVTLTENYISISVPLSLPSTANLTLTDMALAEDFYATSIRTGTLLDLTDWEEARLVVRKMGTAGATDAVINVQYSTVNPGSAFVGGDWNPLGTSDIEVAINVTNTTLASSWVMLPSGARADVYVSPIMEGGDGALDPVIGQVSLQLRRQVVTNVEVEGGGGGGGGGGVSTVPGSTHLYLMSSTIEDAKQYPDWGIPNLSATQRTDTLNIPPGYDDADWTRIVVTLKGLTGALTEDFTVTLRDMTGAVDVATLTIPSATAPTDGKIRAAAAIASGTWNDDTDIRWQVDCQDNLIGGLHAEAMYELNPT